MSPTLNNPHLRRRLALGLISAPAHRNRRRPIWRRHRLGGYGFELAALLAASGMLVVFVTAEAIARFLNL